MVEKVSGVVALSDDALIPVPGNHSLNDCVTGALTVAGRVAHLLSPERILLDKEQQCLAELQDREQVRLRDLEGHSP